MCTKSSYCAVSRVMLCCMWPLITVFYFFSGNICQIIESICWIQKVEITITPAETIVYHCREGRVGRKTRFGMTTQINAEYM